MTVNDLIDLLVLMPGDETVLVGILDNDNRVIGWRRPHDVAMGQIYPSKAEAVIIS